MKSSELNYLKIGFSKISFEGKENKRVDFENGPRMVAMQWGHACGPGCNCVYFTILIIGWETFLWIRIIKFRKILPQTQTIDLHSLHVGPQRWSGKGLDADGW